MVNTALRPDAGLTEILTTRARAASDKRLALDLVVGLSVAAIAFAWQPRGWFLFASAGLCFAAFGAWGVADRELHDPTRAPSAVRVRAFRAVRVIAAIVGGVAAGALLLALVGIALGPRWTS